MRKIKGMRRILYVTLAFLPLCLSLQSCSVGAGGSGGVSNSALAVVQGALQLSDALTGSRVNQYDSSASYLSSHPMLKAALDWWGKNCTNGSGGLCGEAVSGNLQCVEFVTGVYGALGMPLPYVGNGIDFWGLYANKPGWLEVPNGSGLPQPGDIVVWSGGQYGHVAIVVGVVPPGGNQPASVTVAEANAPGNFYLPQVYQHADLYQMPIVNGTVETWRGYAVLGFIRPLQGGASPNTAALQQAVSVNSSSQWVTSQLKNFSPQQQAWVNLAAQDATTFGIQPIYLIAQLLQESGFVNTGPNSAGALGVAQFTPDTALGVPHCVIETDMAKLQACVAQPVLNQCIFGKNSSVDCLGLPGIANGIDPTIPTQAIPAAAYLMTTRYDHYLKMASNPSSQPDQLIAYQRALAAYNAGQGAVDGVVSRCGQTWLTCLDDEQTQFQRRQGDPITHETLNYVNKIMAAGAGTV